MTWLLGTIEAGVEGLLQRSSTRASPEAWRYSRRSPTASPAERTTGADSSSESPSDSQASMISSSPIQSRAPPSATTRNVYGSENCGRSVPSHRALNCPGSMTGEGAEGPQSKATTGSVLRSVSEDRLSSSKIEASRPVPSPTKPPSTR